jgi:DNA-binding LytR/AlgR family response regulator
MGAQDRSAVLQTLIARSSSAMAGSYLRWINASMGNKVILITVDDICYFQSDTKYTRVVTPEFEALIRLSIRELTIELDPAQFWQIHRATLVNAACIHSVSRGASGRVLIKLKQRPESLEVSRAFARRFRPM